MEFPLEFNIYPTCPTTNYYVVKPGDTLYSIARYFKLTIQQLVYTNYGIDPENLYIDQILCIPLAESPISIVIDAAKNTVLLYKHNKIFKKYFIMPEKPTSPITRGVFVVTNKDLAMGEKQGTRWIGLSEPNLGIHDMEDTCDDEKYSSKGDIIMESKDMEEFFNLVPVGTIIEIR